ncbi:MAG: pitrilysin family protein [bacterium]|nr:pitrilysin family protein [bacterium]
MKAEFTKLFDFTEIPLASGCRLYCSEIPWESRVTVGVALPVGSRDDGSLPGLHHFCEHWPFDGTINYPTAQLLAEPVEKYGGYLNAFTNHHSTMYFCVTPLAVESAVHAIADIARQWRFTPKRVDNNRKVITREYWRAESNCYSRFGKSFSARLFKKEHPYHHTVLGTVESINTITLDDVKAMYERDYVSANFNIFLIGNCEMAKYQDLIENCFASVPNRPYARQSIDLSCGLVAGETAIEKDEFWKEAHVLIAAPPCLPLSKRQYHLWSIFCTMMDEGTSSPIRQWREKKGRFYSCGLGINETPDYTLLYNFAMTSADQIKKFQDEFWTIVKRTLLNYGRFQFAQSFRKSVLQYYGGNSRKIFEVAATELITDKVITPLSTDLDIINSITLEDVQLFINSVFSEMTTFTFICQPA